MRAAVAALAGLLLAGGDLAIFPGGGAAGQEEKFGGLPAAPGREEVYYACNACHSIRLVTQQRLSRQRWDELLDWMVAKQGMAELAAADRAVILDYLAAHYGQDVPRS